MLREPIQLTPDRCYCGGPGSVWHWLSPRRTAYVECLRCGARGPEVVFQDAAAPHDEAEFLAIARWNAMHYKG